MIIAIIPARGESKRIPGKNIKLFAGKPIIAYSIIAAKKAEIFDKIIVSTDSHKIAEVAKAYGAKAPFMRPKELADDYTPTVPVLIHALKTIEQRGEKVDYCCCIYATAPFIQPYYIKEGFRLIKQEKATTAFAITTYPSPIFRALGIENMRLKMIWPKYENTRSNDLPEAYHDAGQFYWINVKKFLKDKKLYSDNSVPVIIPRYQVQDIDTQEDWEMAERLFLAQRLYDNQ